MTILSKHSPTNWRKGGFGKGDFHFWVETSWGEIIDPVFPQHHDVCNSRGLDINKPKYQEWDNQDYWFKDHKIDKFLDSIKKGNDYEKMRKKFKPMWARCGYNACMKYLENPTHYRIVCGSMGWKKKGLSSVVWYEFG
tara:strand:+ start:70 stop:483 length:414 start_codon:yes stop_codon:yes gene_type:complete